MRTTIWMAAAVAVLFAAQSHAQENPWRSPMPDYSMQLPYEYPSIIDYSPRMTFEPYQPYSSGWMEDFGRPTFEFQAPAPTYQVPRYAPSQTYQMPAPATTYQMPRHQEPSFHETFMREMQAKQQRQAWEQDRAYRANQGQYRRNGLYTCAQYNIGCAKELWGMGE